MTQSRAPRERWWVLQHHDQMTVSRGNEPPDTKVEKGERAKRAYGPFADKAAAERYANELNGRTLRARVG